MVTKTDNNKKAPRSKKLKQKRHTSPPTTRKMTYSLSREFLSREFFLKPRDGGTPYESGDFGNISTKYLHRRMRSLGVCVFPFIEKTSFETRPSGCVCCYACYTTVL